MNGWTLEQIAATFVLIMSLGGGIKYILTPVINYNKKQKEIDDHFEAVDEKLDNDNKRLNRLEDDNQQILLTLLALLQHDIDGNDIETLKRRKAGLSAYMVQHR